MSKEAHPIVRQLEKITVKKAQAKVVKCAKTNLGSLGTPLGHLNVKHAISKFEWCFCCLGLIWTSWFESH